MSTVIRWSRIAFSLCIIATAIQQLIYGDSDFFPDIAFKGTIYHAFAYLWNVAFALSGVALLFNIKGYLVSLVSAGVFLVILFLIQLPHLLFFTNNAHVLFDWAPVNEASSFAGAWLIVAGSFTSEGRVAGEARVAVEGRFASAGRFASEARVASAGRFADAGRVVGEARFASEARVAGAAGVRLGGGVGAGDEGLRVGGTPPLLRWVEKLIPFGGFFFSVMLILYGLDHFYYNAAVATMVPAWIPDPSFWTYLTGTALVAAGVAIILKIQLKWVGGLLALMFFIWFVFLHIPRAWQNPVGDGGLELRRVFVISGWVGIALLLALSGKATPHRVAHGSVAA